MTDNPKDAEQEDEEIEDKKGQHAEVDPSLTFTSLPLWSLVPEVELPCDIYLFLNGHFIKFKHKGDEIPSDRYNNFIISKITHLFTTSSESGAIVQWAKKTEELEHLETLERVGKEHEEMVTLNREIKKDILGIFTKELTNEDARGVFLKATEFVKKACETKEAHSALRRLLGYSRTLADHSVNVANLSMYLAHYLSYSNQTVLKNIYLGALYHDIGKTRIDPKLTPESNPKAYSKAQRAHPELGKTLLLTKTDLPEEVLRIVGEHHERNDGQGYPKKLTGNRIFDLAKVVTIANEFDNYVCEAEGDLAQKQKTAVKILEEDGGHLFDPKKIEKCVEAIRYGI